jgi:predicted outer membrane repeat protein
MPSLSLSHTPSHASLLASLPPQAHFEGNQATNGNGGAVLSQVPATSVTGCTFTSNSAANAGGAVLAFGDSLTLTQVGVKGAPMRQLRWACSPLPLLLQTIIRSTCVWVLARGSSDGRPPSNMLLKPVPCVRVALCRQTSPRTRLEWVALFTPAQPRPPSSR